MMKSAWGTSTSGERRAPPVEMRFVDMFMAALGALIFMAMLLAFLLRFRPPPPEVIQNDAQDIKRQPFVLTTKSLPPAAVGEPYEIAFAFQGGLPPTVWTVSAGEGEVPTGLRFDAALGILTGTPTSAGTSRFVIKADDQSGASESRPYELVVREMSKTSRRIETVLAVVLFLVALLLWLGTAMTTRHSQRVVIRLRSARASGQSGVQIETGRGTTETVDFGEGGLETHEANLNVMQKISRFFFLVLVALAIWLGWRLWPW